MDLVEQVHIFGFSNIHTFGPNIGLNSLMLNYAKHRMSNLKKDILNAHPTAVTHVFL